MNVFRGALICLILAGAAGSARCDIPRRYREGLPFTPGAVREPNIPARSVAVTAYGAVGDGLTMNTEAFGKAIRALAGAGGGTLDVPPGIWLTGPVRLLSNIRLSIHRGAVLLFSRHFEDYPLIAGPDPGSKGFRCVPCLYGYRLENVAITGGGSIDGQGEFWRPVKKEKMTPARWRELLSSGGAVSADSATWYPSRGAMEGEELLSVLSRTPGATAEDYRGAREFLRPVMVQLVDCRRVLIDGPAFTNSPSFHIQPVECEDVVIRHVAVTAEWSAQNADGIDISSCRRVVVYDCTVNAGDDAICIKPGRISPRQSPGPACENIVIADCVVYHGHGGFVIGSQTYGGARNIAVRNCVFHGTDVGLRFKSAKGKGGLIENVFVDGVRMTAIAGEAILFDLLYASSSGTASTGDPSAGGEHLPGFRRVVIRNVTCAGARSALRMLGLASAPVRGVTIEGFTAASATGIQCSNAEGIAFRNVHIDAVSGPVFSLVRCRGMTLDGAPLPGTDELVVAADGTGGFVTIQSALDAVPDGNRDPVVIFIRKGTYPEKLFMTKSHVTLLGEDRDSTRIVFAELRENWNRDHGRSDRGSGVVNIDTGVTDVAFANLTVYNNYGALHGTTKHQFAVRGAGTRIMILGCNVLADGGDTVSLWDRDDGMYYHAECRFEGWVDYVCPRGWCYVRDSRFFGHNTPSASIWHDGSGNRDQKFVIRDSYFDGVPGFPLGRNHLDGAIYLIGCRFSKNMADRPFYRPPSSPREWQWGDRHYFAGCRRDSADYAWFRDNLSSAEGAPAADSIDARWTFGGRWDPEASMTPLLPYAILPSPRNGEGGIDTAGVRLSWVPARGEHTHALFLGKTDPPEFSRDLGAASFATGRLDPGTTYYWGVAGQGHQAEKVWKFTTK